MKPITILVALTTLFSCANYKVAEYATYDDAERKVKKASNEYSISPSQFYIHHLDKDVQVHLITISERAQDSTMCFAVEQRDSNWIRTKQFMDGHSNDVSYTKDKDGWYHPTQTNSVNNTSSARVKGEDKKYIRQVHIYLKSDYIGSTSDTINVQPNQIELIKIYEPSRKTAGLILGTIGGAMVVSGIFIYHAIQSFPTLNGLDFM